MINTRTAWSDLVEIQDKVKKRLAEKRLADKKMWKRGGKLEFIVRIKKEFANLLAAELELQDLIHILETDEERDDMGPAMTRLQKELLEEIKDYLSGSKNLPISQDCMRTFAFPPRRKGMRAARQVLAVDQY